MTTKQTSCRKTIVVREEKTESRKWHEEPARQAQSNAKSASARSDVHRPPEPKLDIGTAKEHLKLESGRRQHDPQSAACKLGVVLCCALFQRSSCSLSTSTPGVFFIQDPLSVRHEVTATPSAHKRNKHGRSFVSRVTAALVSRITHARITTRC